MACPTPPAFLGWHRPRNGRWSVLVDGPTDRDVFRLLLARRPRGSCALYVGPADTHPDDPLGKPRRRPAAASGAGQTAPGLFSAADAT